MKKTVFALLLLTSLSKTAFSGEKLRLGIKVNPAVSFASIRDKDGNDATSFSSNGSSLRFIVGPFADVAINDNVYFGFGLWYSPRTVKIQSRTRNLLGGIDTDNSQYNLQYLMVPLYFRFFTNEVTPGLKVYFNLGGSADFKIAEKNIGDRDDVGLKDAAVREGSQLFSFIDAGLLLGAGVEFKLGEITTLYGGFSYNRGLTNIVNPLFDVNNRKPYQFLSVKNNLIGLDLGIKF